MKIQLTTRGAWAIVACAAILASACSEGSTGPAEQPGVLAVSVSGSGGGAAAFLITVTGTGITDPTAANASHQVYAMLAGNKLTAAVVLQNPLLAGDILKFSVPDVNAAGSYDIELVQVAGTDNALLSTSGFTIQLTN